MPKGYFLDRFWPKLGSTGATFGATASTAALEVAVFGPKWPFWISQQSLKALQGSFWVVQGWFGLKRRR